MLKKIPIVATELNFGDIYKASRGLFSKEKYRKQLGLGFSNQASKSFFFDSATSGLFVLFSVLKSRSSRDEVIIPAYTAAGVVNAVRKAGLKVVLCDIDLKSFNLDADSLDSLVSDKTLVIVAVHMFGIPLAQVGEIGRRYPGAFLIEDCAQAQGSTIDGKDVGSFSDAAIFSFNRGKNLPTYGGGAVIVNSLKYDLAGLDKGLPRLTFFEFIKLMAKIKILALAMNPYIYGMIYPLISKFKEQSADPDFEAKEYTELQAALALELLKKSSRLSRKRRENAGKIIGELEGYEALVFPQIPENVQPALNRLPVLFKDLGLIDKVKDGLDKAGIESSRMYYQPLHLMFDLGYKKSDFPKAEYFAEHLLTLPVHPLMKDKDITRLIETIKRCL